MDKDDKKVNLLQAATLIGKEISSVHAQDVDAKARFPVETFSALREQSVLSAAVPEELGGGGDGFLRIVNTAKVFKVHNIKTLYANWEAIDPRASISSKFLLLKGAWVGF